MVIVNVLGGLAIIGLIYLAFIVGNSNDDDSGNDNGMYV